MAEFSPFDVIPYPQVAAAYKEMFEPDACKAMLGDSYPDPGDENPSFPPEPTELLCVTGVFRANFDSDELVQHHAALSNQRLSKKQILGYYRSTISSRHKRLPELLKLTRHMPGLRSKDDLKATCLDMLRSAGRRLVAAHVIGRVERTDQLLDALLFPAAISEGITLQIRHHAVAAMARLATDDPLRNTLRSFMDTGPYNRDRAAVAAASFLPDIRVMQKSISANRGTAGNTKDR